MQIGSLSCALIELLRVQKLYDGFGGPSMVLELVRFSTRSGSDRVIVHATVEFVRT